MPCLDDNAINAYLTRVLSDAERQQVAEHLSSCDTCLAIVCAAARRDDPAPPSAPRRIGRYSLVEMLGQGGMGSVYLAHDPELDRDIALKVVRGQPTESGELSKRLSREARAMAKVRHPNVVTVYDVGEVDGTVFIAMELVDGETLTRWLAAGERSWREVVRMFVAAGHGLVAAHAAGIVHRDFKPENVLVDRSGRVQVSDFGLAAIASTMATAATAVAATAGTGSLDRPSTRELASFATHGGTMLGTPRYMSPEQFRGEPTDASSDQFNFAVALYEALYGASPFEATTFAQLAAVVTEGKLRERAVGTRVPRRVHRVLIRALETSSAARFPSMSALLDALERAARPRWRSPAVVVSGASVVAVAVATVVGLAASDRSEPPPPAGGAAAAVDDGRRIPMFVGRFLNRTGDPRLDDTLDAIVGEVAFSSTRLDPVAGVALVGAANSLGVDPADVDAVAAKVAEHDLRRTIVVHGSVAASGAGYVVALDASDRGASHPRFASSRHADGPDDVVAVTARLAATMLEALGDPPVPAAATHVLSSSLAAVHAWSDGERHAMRDDNTGAIARYRDAVALDPEFAEARSSLGLGLYNAGARVDAITELERAVQTVDRIPERQRLTLMGDYYGSVGRYSESIMAYEQLLAKWPGDARTEINLVATALDADSWQIALEAGRRAAKDHPQYEVVRRNLVLAELGNELLDDARRDGSALLASANQPSSQALTSLMVADALLDRRDEARGLLARLRAIDPDRVPLVTADLALYEGRLDDADVALHAGSATPASQLVIARLQLRRGERAGALAAATAAMAIEGLPVEYLAASLVVDAGGSTGIADKARAWRASPEGPRRCFGALLDGDLALAAHRASDAVAAYREAARLGSSWIIHARLARGLLAADQIAEAEHELGWCLAHRGQGALVENPSLSLLPEVYVEVARSADARNADPAHVREAYRAVVDLAPAAQHDPWTELARQRLAALSP